MRTLLFIWFTFVLSLCILYCTWMCLDRRLGGALEIACRDCRITESTDPIDASDRARHRPWRIKLTWILFLISIVMGAILSAKEYHERRVPTAVLIATCSAVTAGVWLGTPFIRSRSELLRVRSSVREIIPIYDAIAAEWPSTHRVVQTRIGPVGLAPVPEQPDLLLLEFPDVMAMPCNPIVIRSRGDRATAYAFMMTHPYWLVRSNRIPRSLRWEFYGEWRSSGHAVNLGDDWWYVEFVGGMDILDSTRPTSRAGKEGHKEI